MQVERWRRKKVIRVLSSTSEYYKTSISLYFPPLILVFASGFSEGLTNENVNEKRVVSTEVDFHTLHNILHYLYTNQVTFHSKPGKEPITGPMSKVYTRRRTGFHFLPWKTKRYLSQPGLAIFRMLLGRCLENSQEHTKSWTFDIVTFSGAICFWSFRQLSPTTFLSALKVLMQTKLMCDSEK